MMQSTVMHVACLQVITNSASWPASSLQKVGAQIDAERSSHYMAATCCLQVRRGASSVQRSCCLPHWWYHGTMEAAPLATYTASSGTTFELLLSLQHADMLIRADGTTICLTPVVLGHKLFPAVAAAAKLFCLRSHNGATNLAVQGMPTAAAPFPAKLRIVTNSSVSCCCCCCFVARAAHSLCCKHCYSCCCIWLLACIYLSRERAKCSLADANACEKVCRSTSNAAGMLL
jgi:hypothetical protein